MALLFAAMVGVLYAAAFHMMLRRSIAKMVIGLILLSHGANLLIFFCGGVRKGAPPIIPPGSLSGGELVTDPVPQALILTAIVISFGVLAFSLVLAYRAFLASGSDDSDRMTEGGA